MFKYRLVLIPLILKLFCIGINALEVLNPYSKALKLLSQHEPPTNWLHGNNKNAKDVEELWLTQQLDYSATNSRSNATWSMRYLRNAKYFRPQGPIFIFVGGEWEISPGHLLTGLMHDLAQQHGGMLYYTEHRYYGQSWPKSNASITNLRYLSVHQALADLAYFIAYQKESTPELKHSKVILVGGSYSGSMVALFMQQYPKLADVAWASSAPMRAKLDFHEYLELVGQAIRLQGGEHCYKRIAFGMSALQRMLRNHSETEELINRLHICRNFNVTRQLDMATFFNGIHNYFAAIVQSYSSRIGDMCLSLMSLDQDPAKAFIKYLTYVFWPEASYEGQRMNEFCYDYTFEAMQILFTNVHDKESGTRPWFYQTCNEFGWFTTATSSITSNQRHHPFATQVPLTFFQRLCQAVFGEAAFTLPQLTHRIALTNKYFSPSSTYLANNGHEDKVLYTHGYLDPWRGVGVQSGRNVLVIPGYSHTADLGSIDLSDSIDLNISKLKVAAFLQRVLRRHAQAHNQYYPQYFETNSTKLPPLALPQPTC